MTEFPQKTSEITQNPLEVRFLALQDYLESKPPYQLALDEYFRIGAAYFHQEARKGGEDHEAWGQKAAYFDRVNGGDSEYKWAWCLGQRKALLDDAVQNEQSGKRDIAETYRTKAEHWLELSYACRRQARGGDIDNDI